MAHRRRSVRRVVIESVVAAAIGFVAVAAVLLLARGGHRPERADIPDGSISVAELVGLGSSERDVVVTGFVFVGRQRTVLCEGRNHDEPPYCDGVTIELDGLDTSRLDLVVPEDAPAYSRDAVTLAGTYARTELVVDEILQGP